VDDSPTGRTGHDLITALVIPPGTTAPITLAALEDSTPAIAEAVGTSRVDDEQLTICTDITIAVHLDDHVGREGGPAGGNQRAAAILARLGVEQRKVLGRLHGTVVITGRGPWGADTCVPPEVLTAVEQCGLKAPINLPSRYGNSSPDDRCDDHSGVDGEREQIFPYSVSGGRQWDHPEDRLSR
jgi:hypothetical protein